MQSPHDYLFSANREITPMITRTGSAIQKSPASTIPMSITGSKIKLSTTFDTPHAILNANDTMLPNTTIIKKQKINVHIYLFPPKCVSMILS